MAVTPNGYADAPNDGYFVMPEERTMQLTSFLEVMENPGNHSGVRNTIVLQTTNAIVLLTKGHNYGII